MNVIQRLREARSAEQIAVEIEPLAQALAILAEEAAQALEQQKLSAQSQSKSQSKMLARLEESTKAAQRAADQLEAAAAAASAWNWRHFAGVLAASAGSLLVLWIGLLFWLNPVFFTDQKGRVAVTLLLG